VKRGGLLVSLLIFAVGCAATRVAPDSVQLRQAQAEIAASELVDVVIAPLGTGVPEDPALQDEDVYPEVRKAEARFFAVLLKRTLERTGHWGSVSVAPASDDAALLVQGEIVESDGESLVVDLVAVDASGREWLDRRYRSTLPLSVYRAPQEEPGEPFQDLYNHVANDLLEARESQPEGAVADVVRVSELRFAADLAPEAFADHIDTDAEGRTRVKRLPARDDPILAHVRAVRERDAAVREALDETYEAFYRDLQEPYQQWRSFTAEEVIAFRKLEREANLQMGLGILATIGGMALAIIDAGLASQILSVPLIVGGVYSATSGFTKMRESSIHAGAIEELGRSFDADVEPRVIQVQGETFRLTGNAEAQYEDWRRLLREIYEAETGLSAAEQRATRLEEDTAVAERE